MQLLEWTPEIVVLLLAGTAAVTDTRTGHIPNWITFPPIFVAPVIWALVIGQESGTDAGLLAAGQSIFGLFLCGIVPYFLFRMGGMGGGDVKLFAGIGAILGAKVGIEIEMAAMVVGAIYSIGKLSIRGGLGRMLTNSLFIVVNPFLPAAKKRVIKPEESEHLRLGASIFVGALAVIAYRAEVFA